MEKLDEAQKGPVNCSRYRGPGRSLKVNLWYRQVFLDLDGAPNVRIGIGLAILGRVMNREVRKMHCSRPLKSSWE